MTSFARTFATLLLLFGVASTTHAQSTFGSQFGVRAGVSGNPGQFFVGFHYETRPITRHITFRPNLEVGFGDNQTVTTINIEFVYNHQLDNPNWRIYFGGGPAAVFRHFDQSDTDVGPGFNFLLGGQHRRGLFTEIKVGVADSPGVKLTVGYAFR